MKQHRRFSPGQLIPYLALLLALNYCLGRPAAAQEQSPSTLIADLQTRMVKINGSGGFRGLENYQSGFLISADGYVLTVWSYVLDGDSTDVTLDNGRKYSGKLIGFDPQSELAVLKIAEQDLPFFNLRSVTNPRLGTRVLALSNLYGIATGNEPTSALHGVVSAIGRLDARRGAKASAFHETVYFLDAITNNAGSAGGAVVDWQGNLLGVIGKELTDSRQNTFVNFAIPTSFVGPVVERIISGKSLTVNRPVTRSPTESTTSELLGLELVTDVVQKTPPYIDAVKLDSAADKAGLQPDDLIVEVNGSLVTSIRQLVERFKEIDRDATVSITVERENQFLRFELKPWR
jgi:serine protease Do